MNGQLVLGSGELYIAAYVPDTGIPDDAVLETETNKMGYIKGGASLDYKPNEYEIFDDGFNIQNRYIVSEEVTFKSGVLTWNTNALKKLTARNTFADDAVNQIRTLKLGGVGARLMDEYVVRFVHTYSDGNKLRITLVATASNGFSLAFAPDKETVIDAEFKAKAHGSDSVQVIIAESYGTGVFYTVTNTLDAGIVTNNLVATAPKGAAYNAIISAVNGEAVDSVTVEMGEDDISLTAYTAATGAIAIPSVSDNIVITATASA